MPSALWSPSADRVSRTEMARFLAEVARRTGLPLAGYDDLYRWSLEHPEAFWSAVWEFTGIRASVEPERVRSSPVSMDQPQPPGTRWFEGARLNFAENLLRRSDDAVALIATGEDESFAQVTYAELRQQVAQLQGYLQQCGVGPGDRVAGFVPNRPEAVVAMLATTGLGAIWSSCSPDFGFQGVLDRFGQIQPRVLVACDGYRYGGRAFPTVDRIARVCEAVPSIEHVIRLEVLGLPWPAQVPAIPWSGALQTAPKAEPHFEQLPPDHPVYVLYSSGTTGVPKCIVHGAAGTLVQHAKELMLHTDVHASDTLFYFTTCGWMMWNWLVSGLMTGGRVVLFDGNPGHPDLGVLWRMAERCGVTHFGTSPKFLASLQQQGLHPCEHHDLSALRTVLSTGAPLSADLFRWVYAHVKEDLQLASISGGTDIVSCFMLGSPIDPVYAGEIQKRGLGMAVEAWSDAGHPVIGEKGELVCTAPFPSMPVGFYDDPEGHKYRDAYFERFPGVWRHGDFVEITERGGIVVFGRSDATLNPGGVRIGTAEIYRVVESLPEITDSVVIGLPSGDDVEIVLFVVLASGDLTDAFATRLRSDIRRACSPRHVPKKILACPAVPRTISGKKVEIAVRRVLLGEAAPNRDALANPEALDFFEALAGALDQRAR